MKDYQATPEQWYELERCSHGSQPWAPCILELRARVETLEAAAHKHIVETSANILALASRVEALESVKRPASKVYEINEPLKLTPEQAQQVRDLLAPEPRRNYPAKPDSSLVNRIKTAIALVDEEHYWPEERGAVETDMARAALREVAAWMTSNPDIYFPPALVFAIEQEVEQ